MSVKTRVPLNMKKSRKDRNNSDNARKLFHCATPRACNILAKLSKGVTHSRFDRDEQDYYD